MKKNVGNTDKILRLSAALVVVVLYISGLIGGTLAIVLGIAAAVLLLTSAVSFCPLYAMIGVNTCPTKKTL